MIVARHFSAWNSSEKIRPVGNGVILTSARFVAPIVARLSDPIIPSRTVPFLPRLPGTKVPGYDHSVPPGRSSAAILTAPGYLLAFRR